MSEFKESGKFGGIFSVYVKRADGTIDSEEEVHNIVVDEGVNHILESALAAGSTRVTAWYIGLMNDYTPVAGSTMTNLGSTNEFQDYSEATRQAWTVPSTVTGKSMTNSASTATFTCDTDTSTVYGAFIAQSATKAETSSIALCAARFTSSKSLDTDDELVITYAFSADDA